MKSHIWIQVFDDVCRICSVLVASDIVKSLRKVLSTGVVGESECGYTSTTVELSHYGVTASHGIDARKPRVILIRELAGRVKLSLHISRKSKVCPVRTCASQPKVDT